MAFTIKVVIIIIITYGNNKKMVFFAPVIWLYGPFSHLLKAIMAGFNISIPTMIQTEIKDLNSVEKHFWFCKFWRTEVTDKWTDLFFQGNVVQSRVKLYIWLLNKPYVNGVNLRKQDLSLKCCQSFEQKIYNQWGQYLSKQVLLVFCRLNGCKVTSCQSQRFEKRFCHSAHNRLHMCGRDLSPRQLDHTKSLQPFDLQ